MRRKILRDIKTGGARGGIRELRPFIGYYGYWVALTYLSVVSAVLGINFALSGHIGYAIICLMFSGLCDMFDGSVARTKQRNDREKNYGLQIDGLADLVSFGVFPIIIGYAISCGGAAPNVTATDTTIYAVYLLSALIRLAYFNAIETEYQSRNERPAYFVGLPTTSVALIIPAAYAACRFLGTSLSAVYNALLLIIAFAFVSRIKIPKQKGGFIIIIFLIGVAVFFLVLFSAPAATATP